MKIFLSVFSIIFGCYLAKSQVRDFDWIPAVIHTRGEIITADISLDHRYFEGMLLVKEGLKKYSLSPQNVDFFKIKDPEGKDSIQFMSVNTVFLGRNGSKLALLKKSYLGETFSLFSTFIPDRKRIPLLIPFGGAWLSYSVYTYLKDEEVLFIMLEGKAYQITKPGGGKKVFKVQKRLFLEILGDRSDQVKNYKMENKKKLRKRSDIIDIIKYANTLQAPFK